jgi:hypothetical protein
MSAQYPENTQIMFRELLDVEHRASDIHNWYLKPFLEALVLMLKQIKAPDKLSHKQSHYQAQLNDQLDRLISTLCCHA